MSIFSHKIYFSLISTLRQHKIHTRLLLAFLLISLVPINIIGIFAYQTYTQSIHNKVKEACLQSIELLNNNLSTQLGIFSNYIGAISISEAVQNGMSSVNKNNILNSDIVRNINEISTAIPFQNAYLKNLRVVTKQRKIIYDLGYDDITNTQFNELIDKIEQTSPKDSLQYIHTYRASDKIALGRKIYNMHHTSSALGYIIIYIDEALVSNIIFTDVSFGDTSNFLLFDKSGNIISAQKRSWLGRNVKNEIFFRRVLSSQQNGNNYLEDQIDNEQYHIVFTYNDTYDIYLAALIPQSYITQDSKPINIVLIVIALLLIGLSLIITLLVYSSVMQPINAMLYACNTTDEAEIDIRINDKAPDELGFWARTIDNMVHELSILIQRSIKYEKHMRELELQALHYQINPYFLFNTLNTLKWIAKLNNILPVSHGIEALSALLQNTLITKCEMIKFTDELNNLKNYCAIQQLRYAGSFEINYQIADNISNWQVPRFILQPLVENAIIHGQKSKDDLLSIFIQAYRQSDLLIIEINDNGKGFDLTKIKAENFEKFTGIGLNNVDERLKLHYGANFGLIIQSKSAYGTKCILKIPKDIIR